MYPRYSDIITSTRTLMSYWIGERTMATRKEKRDTADPAIRSSKEVGSWFLKNLIWVSCQENLFVYKLIPGWMEQKI